MKKLSLVTDDLIKLVNDSIASSTIRRYELGTMNRFSIGRVIVKCSAGGKPVLELPDSANKEYMKLWKSDVGSVLVRELRKDSPELYELVATNFRVILKKISDDELNSFEEMGFVHISVADSKYTILKAVSGKGHYSAESDDYDLELEDESDDKSQIIEGDEVYTEPAESDSYELF